MCNHIYTASFAGRPASMGKKCPYPEIYNRLYSSGQGRKKNGFKPALPIDSHGVCIFHSKEKAWKRKNDFTGEFLKLLKLLEAEDLNNYYDFAEFRFVGNSFKNKYNQKDHALCFKNITFKKQAYFVGALFEDLLELENVNFEDGASFCEATFAQDVNIQNTFFRGLQFSNAQFKQRALFTNVKFQSYALFDNTKFKGKNAGYVVKFENSQFKGITDFSNCIFSPMGHESTMGFHSVIFEDFTDFKNAQFYGQLIFKNTSFASMTEFTDAIFGTTKSTARYRGLAVEFNQINVLANATLIFMSTDTQKKIFEHDVQITFKDDPVGLIKFENANFSNLTLASRERLIQFAKLGKVEIGPGCIKYRFQTDVKTILVNQGNTSLILELCQTFTNYFTVSNGYSLGLEIIERSKTKISFFYFTDEDITEAIFSEQLGVTEQQLWSLLSIESGDQYLAFRDPDNTLMPNENENIIINTIDGVSALLGTFFRVGARIACGRWKKTDTKALLEAIRFHNHYIENRAKSLHKVLIDKYTGETLFALNIQQNAHLLKIKQTTNIYGDNARINNNSIDNSTNIVSKNSLR